MAGDLSRLLQDGLLATQNVAAAAIVRRKDGSVRVATTGFQLTPDDIRAVSQAFKDTGSRLPLLFNRQEYQCVRADKYSMYAKHVSAPRLPIHPSVCSCVCPFCLSLPLRKHAHSL